MNIYHANRPSVALWRYNAAAVAGTGTCSHITRPATVASDSLVALVQRRSVRCAMPVAVQKRANRTVATPGHRSAAFPGRGCPRVADRWRLLSAGPSSGIRGKRGITPLSCKSGQGVSSACAPRTGGRFTSRSSVPFQVTDSLASRLPVPSSPCAARVRVAHISAALQPASRNPSSRGRSQSPSVIADATSTGHRIVDRPHSPISLPRLSVQSARAGSLE